MPNQTVKADSRGNPLSSSSGEAIERYDAGLDLLLSGNPGAPAEFERAIDADAGFALAYVALARTQQLTDPPRAKENLSRARRLAAGATKHEQRHVAALSEGDQVQALRLAEEHLRESPGDALVVSAAHFMQFRSGAPDRAARRYALTEDVAPAYADDDWWFLSTRAFAHHEMFLLEPARAYAQRSLELMPTNFNAAHSIAHVNEESDEAAEGDRFLADWLPGQQRGAALFGHLAWHRALFMLWSGDHAGIQDYRRDIGPEAPRQIAIGLVADSASLLWRLELQASEGTRPWDELCDYIEERVTTRDNQFTDLHCALSYAASGRERRLGELIDGLRASERDGRVPAGDVVPALAEAIATFSAGDYEATVTLLQPYEEQIRRVGGSHARWEVFEDTLLEAYLRSSRYDLAEPLLRRRLDRRPSERDAQTLELARSAATTGTPAD